MILKPTLYLMSEKILRLGLGFIAGSLIARSLGAVEFGNLSFVMALYLILEPLSQLGLSTLFKKFYLDESIPKQQLITTALFLRISSSFLFTMTLLLYTYYFVEKEQIKLILYLFSSLFFLKSFEIVEWAKEAELELKKISRFKFIIFAVVFIFRIYGVWKSYSILYFSFAFFLEYFLFFIIYIGWLNKRKIIFKFYSEKILKALLVQCWPLIISGLAVTVYMKIDQLMIQYLLDSQSLGIYSASVRISELFNFFPLIISTVFFPLWFKSNERMIIKSFSVMSYASVPLAIFVLIFANYIISFVYGSDFAGAASVLRMHIFSMVFVFWGVMVSNYDIYIEKPVLSMYRTISGAMLNVLLNFWLIPKLGATGAAIGTLISYSFTVFFFNFLFKNLRKLNSIIFKSFSPRYFMEAINEFTQRKN